MAASAVFLTVIGVITAAVKLMQLIVWLDSPRTR